MKTKFTYYLLITLLLCGVFFACNKSTDTPTTTITPVVGGATSNFKDSTSVTIGNVTIKYSKTSQCFPSNEIFAFTAVATGVPSDAVYTWDFGDTHSITGVSVRNIYDVAGTYTVILTIKDNLGQVLSKTSVSIAAWGQQVTPHAVFSAQIYDVNVLNNYAFTSTSSVQRGSITGYTWDWADGTGTTTTANAYTPHNFPQVATDKTYPVKLIATANSGCKDTATVNVSIAAVYNISGDFDAVQYNACTAEYFVFTPNTTGVPAGAVYKWDFADASGTAQGNPITHSFTYQNDYDVKMYIYISGKLIYQTHKPVRVFGQNIKPKALFIKNEQSSYPTQATWYCYSQANIPHGYITGYRWELSTGRVDDNFNTDFTNTFIKQSTPTTYSVKFIVTGNTGCKDTSIGYITIPAL